MIILRQKEYTSVGRKIGAKIGRLKANLANKVYKRAAIQEVENERIGHYVKLKESNPGPNSGQRLTRELLMPIIKDGSIKIKPSDKFRLHYDITGGDNTTMEANIKSRLFAPQFSHELGHYAINTGQDKESKKVFDKLVKLENEKKSSNFLGKIYKQHLKNKYTRKNESNASRNGLEILKQVGANQSELDLAKEVYDKAGKSYETSQKYKLLRDIGDRINIKDRRNTRVMYRGGEPVHVGMTKFKLERRKKKWNTEI